jgi:hypothetical protein
LEDSVVGSISITIIKQWIATLWKVFGGHSNKSLIKALSIEDQELCLTQLDAQLCSLTLRLVQTINKLVTQQLLSLSPWLMSQM